MAGSIGRASILTGALMIGLATAQAADFTVIESKDPKLHFKTITLPDGKSVTYTHGVGSGAFRHPSDPPNVIWTVGDRGPNFTCAEAGKLVAASVAAMCNKYRNGRVYPTPDYVPSIYKLEIDRQARYVQGSRRHPGEDQIGQADQRPAQSAVESDA